MKKREGKKDLKEVLVGRGMQNFFLSSCKCLLRWKNALSHVHLRNITAEKKYVHILTYFIRDDDTKGRSIFSFSFFSIFQNMYLFETIFGISWFSVFVWYVASAVLFWFTPLIKIRTYVGIKNYKTQICANCSFANCSFC